MGDDLRPLALIAMGVAGGVSSGRWSIGNGMGLSGVAIPTPMVIAAELVLISGTGGGGTPKPVGTRAGGGAKGLGGSGRVEPRRTVRFEFLGGGTVEGAAPREGALP